MIDKNKKINIEIHLLKEESEIKDREAFNFDQFSLDVCKTNEPWLNRWKKRFDYMMPGVNQDMIIAIEGFSMADESLDFSAPQFGITTKNYFIEQFGKDNVLACGCGFINGNSVCHFLIFPLNGRQLDPYKWVNGRTKQFSQAFTNLYIEKLSQYFQADLSSDIEEDDNGHTEYLDKFPKVITSPEDLNPIVYETLTEEDQIQTDYPRDKLKNIIKQTVQDFTTGINKGEYIKLMNDSISVQGYLNKVRLYILKMYPDISDTDLELVLKKVKSAATGYYVLDDLINDENISDIKVMRPNLIRVKVRGERRNSNLEFISEVDYFNFIENIMTRHNLTPKKQIHVFTDLKSNKDNRLRLNLTLSDVMTGGLPSLHIRKVPRKKRTIDDLVNKDKMMDRTVANYLLWAAREAKGIVFTGKGSSGKTTLMNTLLEYTPANRSGVVIQESEELFSDTRPEMTFEHITDDYTLKDLARNGLLTDVDYFIIGEVKGDEAMYFINACDTGNKGWCSVHSPSSVEAINKLADYVMYASKYDRESAIYMLKELQVIVFLKNFKVAEISEVVGWDEEKKDLKYKLVFRDEKLIKDMK